MKLKNIFNRSITFFVMLFFYSVAAAQSSTGPDNFTLSGTAKGMEGQYLFLSYKGWGKEREWDSTKVINGKFSFTGRLEDQWKCLLTGKKGNSIEGNMTIPLFLVPRKMTISLVANKFSSAILKGSAPEDEYLALERQKYPLLQKLDPLYRSLDSIYEIIETQTDSLRRIQLQRIRAVAERKSDSIYNIVIALNKTFISSHSSSVAAVTILENYKSDYRGEDLERLFSPLSTYNKSTPWGKRIAEDIQRRSITAKGKEAPLFFGKECSGDTIYLNNYIGKYMLLCFWATWSGPCREAIPQLKEIYSRYKDSLGIIAVSVDADEPAWRRFISYDKLDSWKNILSVKGNNDIAKMYGVQSYPTMILLDKEGKIINSFTDAKAIDDELPAILSKLLP